MFSVDIPIAAKRGLEASTICKTILNRVAAFEGHCLQQTQKAVTLLSETKAKTSTRLFNERRGEKALRSTLQCLSDLNYSEGCSKNL